MTVIIILDVTIGVTGRLFV